MNSIDDMRLFIHHKFEPEKRDQNTRRTTTSNMNTVYMTTKLYYTQTGSSIMAE